MNNILSMMSGITGNGSGNIMMQAFAAMMSGQSAESFMKGLAQSNPALRGIDLDNLENGAKELCKQRGEDFSDAKKKTQKIVRNMSAGKN